MKDKMRVRRISTWIGLSILLLASLVLSSWAVSAYSAYPDLNNKQEVKSQPADTLPSLGVPLRDRWWESVPNIDPATKIDRALLAGWQDSPDAEQGFMVYLKAQADTANSITDWNAKGEYVLRVLETVASATQPTLMQAVNSLQASGNVSRATTFTIINAAFVHGDQTAARDLARRPDVAFVEADHRYFPMSTNGGALPSLVPQRSLATVANFENLVNFGSNPSAIEPGVNRVHAPQVWAMGYRGDGIVIGHIDTGVQYMHPALVNKYRGNLGGGSFDHNYNWWDTSMSHQPAPYDDQYHGTHTIGTVLGDDGDPGTNQIGVAPHAKFISAKVFPLGGSSGNEEITPAEDFMLAPWDLNHQNRRPDLRPHIVTNSWGDNECWNTDSWLIIQAWIDAGIMPVFSNGNAGPGARTVGSPGSYPFLVGVGSINALTDIISGSSSRGPSCYGDDLKPDVVAPGVGVRSSMPTNSYGSLSGTSMAAPHVAGVMALILDANASLTYTDVMGIITRTTFFTPSWGTRPNNNYGWGLVQADSAVDMALHGPRLSGAVASSGTPLPGARINAVRTSDNDTYSVLARVNGTFSMTLLAGTYDLTASAFGYNPQTLSAQNFMSDTFPTASFNLVPQTTFNVGGRLLLSNVCTPLSGTVRIDPPGWIVAANPTTGAYTANLPAGSYTFTANAGAIYQPVTATVNVSGPAMQDFTFGPAHDIANNYYVVSPPFHWIPGDTQITFTSGEDGHTTLTIPFPFTYYGSPYTSVNVGTNGLLTFQTSASSSDMWANTNIPNPGPTPAAGDPPYPNNAIYPYWDDLGAAPRYYGNAYWGVSGSAPNRIFVVEWRGVAGAGGPITFEVHLEESTNRIVFLYQNLDAPYGYGYSATIGIENASGTDGMQLVFNQPGAVGNKLAYCFIPGPAPVVEPCLPGPTYTATTTPAVTATSVGPTMSRTPTSTRTNTPAATSPTATSTTAITATPGSPTATAMPGSPTATAMPGSPTATATPGSPTATATPCEITFSDVSQSDYFYEPVKYLACHGVISGYEDGTFRPYNNTTRGQLTKIIVIAEGWDMDCPTQPTFTDVPPDNPFFCFVETALDHSIITGYSDDTFRPGNDVTRGQLCKIVVLAEEWEIDSSGGPHFSDVEEGSTFYDFIETAYNHEIITGYADGTFEPGKSATRGQISKIVYLAITQP